MQFQYRSCPATALFTPIRYLCFADFCQWWHLRSILSAFYVNGIWLINLKYSSVAGAPCELFTSAVTSSSFQNLLVTYKSWEKKISLLRCISYIFTRGKLLRCTHIFGVGMLFQSFCILTLFCCYKLQTGYKTFNATSFFNTFSLS